MPIRRAALKPNLLRVWQACCFLYRPCSTPPLHLQSDMRGSEHELRRELFPPAFLCPSCICIMLGTHGVRRILAATAFSHQAEVIHPDGPVGFGVLERRFKDGAFRWQCLQALVITIVEHMHPLIELRVLAIKQLGTAQFQSEAIRDGWWHRMAVELVGIQWSERCVRHWLCHARILSALRGPPTDRRSRED